MANESVSQEHPGSHLSPKPPLGKRVRVVRPKTPGEQAANQITHGAGVVLSLVAIVLLILRALPGGDSTRLISYVVFGVSMLILYVASLLYHSARTEKQSRLFKVFDHAAIYVLIAGSYTPFMATVLGGRDGAIMLTVVWTLAFMGVVFKLFFAHRFKLASTFVYLLMGWMVLLVVRPLAAALPSESLSWLVAGGLSYSTGVVFYLWDRLRFQHALWHAFVLFGSASHVAALLTATP
jgi:hemolysin III